MSVLAAKRKESKFEAITFSVELHNMLIELMQRHFGVKDLGTYVRKKFEDKSVHSENYAKYHYLMYEFRKRIDNTAAFLESNVRAANSIYPTSMHEHEQRRDFQNMAIISCEQLIRELQRVVDIFDVDINSYERYIRAIDHEINLIKRWRQRDNKIKSYLQG